MEKFYKLTEYDVDHIKMACDPFQNSLEDLKACVQRFMSKNARMYVDLSTLFSFVSLKPALVPATKALVV